MDVRIPCMDVHDEVIPCIDVHDEVIACMDVRPDAHTRQTLTCCVTPTQEHDHTDHPHSQAESPKESKQERVSA